MRNAFSNLLCSIVLSLFCITSTAQSIALKAPENPIVIDGDQKEWGDNLIYNTDKNLYYGIANDKQNLYLIIKTKDEAELNNILLSGVTFSIDTKGRKKRTYSVTFPVQEMYITRNTSFKTMAEKRDVAKSTRLRKIEVKGFKDVVDDELYAGNPYKIQTALNFDDNGFLVYEEAIPLSLFHAEELMNNEWAYNIKLNAVSVRLPANGQTTVGNVTVTSAIVAVPAGSGPPSSTATSKISRNGSSTQSTQNSTAENMVPQEVEIVKASDFWGTFKLADIK